MAANTQRLAAVAASLYVLADSPAVHRPDNVDRIPVRYGIAGIRPFAVFYHRRGMQLLFVHRDIPLLEQFGTRIQNVADCGAVVEGELGILETRRQIKNEKLYQNF